MRRVKISCHSPKRRDALEEAARLALAYVSVGTGPDFPDFVVNQALELHLSASALTEGCHLPETAMELLEAVQAFGIPVKKITDDSAVPTEEWSEFWSELGPVVPVAFHVELEIV